MFVQAAVRFCGQHLSWGFAGFVAPCPWIGRICCPSRFAARLWMGICMMVCLTSLIYCSAKNLQHDFEKYLHAKSFGLKKIEIELKHHLSMFTHLFSDAPRRPTPSAPSLSDGDHNLRSVSLFLSKSTPRKRPAFGWFLCEKGKTLVLANSEIFFPGMCLLHR